MRVAHAPGMPGTFSPPPRVSNPDMHHGTSVTHMPWCMPGSLTSGFLWSRWQGKPSQHSLRMRNLQFYVSGKRPIEVTKWMANEWTVVKWTKFQTRNINQKTYISYIIYAYMQTRLNNASTCKSCKHSFAYTCSYPETQICIGVCIGAKHFIDVQQMYSMGIVY